MQIVQFPDVAQTFDRALQEVLGSYLDGNSHTIGQVTLTFLNSEIDFGFKRFDNTAPSDIPEVIFLGSRSTKFSKEKCNDPKGVKPFAYEQRSQTERKVFIRVKLGKDVNAAERVAKKLWGELVAIFNSQQRAFSLRGIHLPRLEPNPDTTISTEDLHAVIYFGYLYCNLRYTYTQDV